MFELRPHDFKLEVCVNPSHGTPIFVSAPWCNTQEIFTRNLLHYEQQIIDERKTALIKRLGVVKTNWELMQAISCFYFGGWNPEVDERIIGKKGEHL